MKDKKKVYIAYYSSEKAKNAVHELTKKLETHYEIIHYADDERRTETYILSEYFHELGSADRVIVLIDKNYLTKSKYCAEEMQYIMSFKNVKQRVFPVLIDENFEIFDEKDNELVINEAKKFIDEEINKISIQKDKLRNLYTGYKAGVEDFIETLKKENWSTKISDIDILKARLEKVTKPEIECKKEIIGYSFFTSSKNINIEELDELLKDIKHKNYDLENDSRGYICGTDFTTQCEKDIKAIVEKKNILFVIIDSYNKDLQKSLDYLYTVKIESLVVFLYKKPLTFDCEHYKTSCETKEKFEEIDNVYIINEEKTADISNILKRKIISHLNERQRLREIQNDSSKNINRALNPMVYPTLVANSIELNVEKVNSIMHLNKEEIK